MVSVQRRLNSTDRRRITRDRVNIVLDEPLAGFPSATAKINLDGLDLPEGARVVVEAYYRSSSMRFPCGTVAHIAPTAPMVLSEIDRGGAVQFRVLVIAADGSGRIIASAERVRPTKSDDGPDRQPLLPLRKTDLGKELWKIDIDPRGGPTLLINNRVPDLAARLPTWPLLQGLILPHAFRAVLQKLGFAGEEEGDDPWGEDWRKFLRDLDLPTEPEDRDDEDAREEWVEAAVRAFCELKDFPARIKIAETAGD